MPVTRVSAADGGSAISKARDRAAALRARSEALLDQAELQIEMSYQLHAQFVKLRRQASALWGMCVSRRASRDRAPLPSRKRVRQFVDVPVVRPRAGGSGA